MRKTNLLWQSVFLWSVFLLMVTASFCQAAVQLTYPATLRLLSVTGVNTVQFKLTVTPPVGTTIVSVYAKINGTIFNAGAPSGNVYPINWTSSAFGSNSLKGYATYSNGAIDSTNAMVYKVIQTSSCGVVTYNNNTGYVAGDTVATVSDSVYKRTSFWQQGDYPTISNANWTFLGMCNSNLYTTFNCDNIQNWSATATYPTPNLTVKLNNEVYKNSYYIQGESPDTSAAWKKKGACGIYNQLPYINTIYDNDTVIVMNPITPLTIPANISDADGNIISTSFTINGNNQTPSVSGNNYTLNFTAPNHGDYLLNINATDDENGTSIVSALIRIMPSMIPVITPVYPTDNQVIGNISTIGSTPVQLVATATDPDNAIANVTMSIDGGTPMSTTVAGNNYSTSWTPTAYGSYTLTIKATDVTGAFTNRVVDFTIDNPSLETVSFASLPLQLKANLGNTKTFTMDANIQSVVVRNKSMAKVSFNGNQLIVTGQRTGRTGLKITTTSNVVYYVGLRMNENDGTAPGLPPYASIGFVSEDSPSDLGFWEDMDTDLTNKNVDVRYIYINDGPIGSCDGCTTWRDSTRHINYCKNSLKYGITPFFVYYNVPNAGESFTTDLAHAQDTNYMKAYFNDLTNFLRQCHEVMGEDLFGIVLEPDFLGYMQQLGVINVGTNDPALITTCVTANGIAYNSGSITSLVTRINKTVKNRRDMGANIYFGWQMNLWSDGTTAGPNGIMRTTDNMGWLPGRQNVVNGATNVTNYISSAGVLSNGADFISMDKYGLDAGAFNQNYAWWFNNDHWDNYMLYAKTVHEVSGKPVVLWQLPIGHINNSTYTSAYTGAGFAPFPNTNAHYEDPTTSYFFGDKFIVSNPAKKTYLSQNLAADTSLHVLTNDTLQWGNHIEDFASSGIVHAMFGAGVGNSTNGIHDIACQTCGPTDDYWSIQKIQDYYENNISWVDTTAFTSGILSFEATDNSTIKLRCLLGQATYMYYGYNGAPVGDTGNFIPATFHKGMNYVSFVSNEGQNAFWKVQRIMIVDNLPPGTPSTVKLPDDGTTIIAGTGCEPAINGWIYYKDPADNRYVVAIDPNGNNWNPNSVVITTQMAPYYDVNNTVALSKRYVAVDAPGTYNVNGGVKMRMFFAPADTFNLIPNPVYGNWYKFNGIGPANVQAAISGGVLTNSTIPAVELYDVQDNIDYVQFEGLTSFSTFGYVTGTVQQPQSVNEQGIAKQVDITVAPNPATNMVTLYTNDTQHGTATIISIDGRVLKTIDVKSNAQSIDLSEISDGMYLLVYRSKSANKTIKIVKKQ